MKKNMIISLSVFGILIISAAALYLSGGLTSAINQINRRNDKLLQYFERTHPDKSIVSYIEGDVDADGSKDLVVIYTAEKNANKMVVMVDKDGIFEFSDELSVPDTNPKLQFKYYNNQPTNEFIVSGWDNSGNLLEYVTYRLDAMKLVDVFDAGE